jgi:hypothetical protein
LGVRCAEKGSGKKGDVLGCINFSVLALSFRVGRVVIPLGVDNFWCRIDLVTYEDSVCWLEVDEDVLLFGVGSLGRGLDIVKKGDNVCCDSFTVGSLRDLLIFLDFLDFLDAFTVVVVSLTGTEVGLMVGLGAIVIGIRTIGLGFLADSTAFEVSLIGTDAVPMTEIGMTWSLPGLFRFLDIFGVVSTFAVSITGESTVSVTVIRAVDSQEEPFGFSTFFAAFTFLVASMTGDEAISVIGSSAVCVGE